MGDKELLQTSMLSGNKRKLEGYSIYFSGVAFHTAMYTQERKKKTSWSQNYAWKSKSPLKYSIQHLQTMLEADSQYAQHSQFFLSVQTDGSFFG